MLSSFLARSFAFATNQWSSSSSSAEAPKSTDLNHRPSLALATLPLLNDAMTSHCAVRWDRTAAAQQDATTNSRPLVTLRMIRPLRARVKLQLVPS